MARRNLTYDLVIQSALEAETREDNLANFADRLGAAMGRLGDELREGWKAREENHVLRQENEHLRSTLQACVESCERFLGPVIDADDQDDHNAAREALDAGRRVLRGLV